MLGFDGIAALAEPRREPWGDLCNTRLELVQTLVQVSPRGGREVLILGADHRAGFIDDQLADTCLKLDSHPLCDRSLAERLDDAGPWKCTAIRTVAALRRLRFLAVRREGLVSGVIEMVFIRRIRGLDGAEVGQERDAALGQPFHVRGTRLTEVVERLRGNRVLHFHRQVTVHVVHRVLDTGLLLNVGAASSVEYASAYGGGAASFKTVQEEHLGAAFARFDGGSDARRSQADHDQVCDLVPLRAVHIFEYDRLEAAHN